MFQIIGLLSLVNTECYKFKSAVVSNTTVIVGEHAGLCTENGQ